MVEIFLHESQSSSEIDMRNYTDFKNLRIKCDGLEINILIKNGSAFLETLGKVINEHSDPKIHFLERKNQIREELQKLSDEVDELNADRKWGEKLLLSYVWREKM